MRIILLGNTKTAEDTEKYYGDYAAFFQKAASYGSKDIDVSFALFEDLIISVGDEGFYVTNTRTGDDLSAYDAILIRGKGFRKAFDVIKTVSVYARRHNIPVINDYSSFRDSSKLTQAVQFVELDIPVAQTVLVTPAVIRAHGEVGIAFPCVMKATFGAHGNDNYVVNNGDDVVRIAEKNPELDFVLQRFVPNDRDFRVLIAGDEIRVIARTAVQGSHLNNTSQGGSAELIPADTLPEQAVKDARKIAKHLDMTIAGVDILFDSQTGKYFFLEVNSQPQLMSGAFVDEKARAVGAMFDAL